MRPVPSCGDNGSELRGGQLLRRHLECRDYRMNECVCHVDGFCLRYQKQMVGRLREICAGEVLTHEKCEAYRNSWLLDSEQHGGPGTELKALLESFSLTGDKSCGCEEFAA